MLSIFEVVHLASVRQFRMLTILKAIRSHPEILKIVNSMLAAVPNLSAVLILVIAVLVMWGIIGMFFYGNGTLSGRCYYAPSKTYSIPVRKCLTGIALSCVAPFETLQTNFSSSGNIGNVGNVGSYGSGSDGGTIQWIDKRFSSSSSSSSSSSLIINVMNENLISSSLCPIVPNEYYTVTLPLNMSDGTVVLPKCIVFPNTTNMILSMVKIQPKKKISSFFFLFFFFQTI